MDDPGNGGDGVEALVERIEQARFTVAFRGFEPREVQDFLHGLAEEIRGLSFGAPGDSPPPAPAPPQVPKTWAKAEAEAAELLRVAEEKAEAILAEARAEADETLEKARVSLLDAIRNANALIERAKTESGSGPGG